MADADEEEGSGALVGIVRRDLAGLERRGDLRDALRRGAGDADGGRRGDIPVPPR